MQLTFTVKFSKNNMDPMRYTQFLSCDTPQSEKAHWKLTYETCCVIFSNISGPENFTVDKYRRFVENLY